MCKSEFSDFTRPARVSAGASADLGGNGSSVKVNSDRLAAIARSKDLPLSHAFSGALIHDPWDEDAGPATPEEPAFKKNAQPFERSGVMDNIGAWGSARARCR